MLIFNMYGRFLWLLLGINVKYLKKNILVYFIN